MGQGLQLILLQLDRLNVGAITELFGKCLDRIARALELHEVLSVADGGRDDHHLVVAQVKDLERLHAVNLVRNVAQHVSHEREICDGRLLRNFRGHLRNQVATDVDADELGAIPPVLVGQRVVEPVAELVGEGLDALILHDKSTLLFGALERHGEALGAELAAALPRLTLELRRAATSCSDVSNRGHLLGFDFAEVSVTGAYDEIVGNTTSAVFLKESRIGRKSSFSLHLINTVYEIVL